MGRVVVPNMQHWIGSPSGGGRWVLGLMLGAVAFLVLSGSTVRAATVIVQVGQQNGGTPPERSGPS